MLFFLEMTEQLEDLEEIFFQLLGELKSRCCCFNRKTLLSQNTDMAVFDRKIELPALGLNSAFIMILLLNCHSEDIRDIPWPVQTLSLRPVLQTI